MPPPIPRCSSWAYSSLVSPSHFSLPRYGRRVGLHIVLFEACSAFTRVAACTLALSPIRDTLIEGFSHFVTSMTAPIASGWSGCRVGLAPTGKRRLVTAHAKNGSRQPYCSGATPERRLSTSHKKGRGPLNQPKGRHRADRISRDHVEPIDCPLNQGRFEAKRHCGAEQAARR